MYYDPYGYAAGAIVVSIIVGLLVAVAIYVVTALFLRKIFVKAGVANPNVAWIPIYNFLILAKLGDINPLIYLAAVAINIIPFLNYVAWILPLAMFALIVYRVNQKTQKDPILFTILAVAGTLVFGLGPLIWLGIVAFDKSVWNTASKPVAGVAPVPPPPWASQAWLMDTTTWGGVPFQGYAATPPTAPPPAAPPAA